MKPNKELIVVLGMHRSGTSVVTRGLQALGVDLGENLMPAKEGNNERGFFEDLDIFNLNERILSALGTTWHAVCPIDARAFSDVRLDGFKLEAVDILSNRLKSGRIWAFKDPRTCRLLPFWQEIFAHLDLNCRYLLVNRNPISVAKSLAARDGFPVAKSYILWIEHVLGAVKGSAGRPRLVVDYDSVMAAPTLQLQRLGKWLNLSGLALSENAIDEYAARFLTNDLRHSVFREEDLEYDTSAFLLARRTYSLMRRLAADDISFDDEALLKEWAELTETLDSVSPIFTFIDDQDHRLASLGRALSDNRELTAENIRRSEHAISLQAEIEVLRNNYAGIGAVQDRFEQQKAELIFLRAQLTEMESSKSWRLTAPLRWMRRAIRQAIR